MKMDQSEPKTALQLLLKEIENRSEDIQQRKALLENLRTAMSKFSRAELMEEVGDMSLENLFEWLASDDEEEISAVCGILNTLMQILDPIQVLEKYHDAVLQGLQHPRESVRILVLAQFQYCVKYSEESVNVLCSEYQDLIIASINQIPSDDLKVYRAAEHFLLDLVQTSSGANFLLGVAGIQSFKTILNSPRTRGEIKFRLYETLCRFANFSQGNLQRIEAHHLIVNPLGEISFSSEDPLEQLNGLEILSILAESKHGIEHLETTGVMDKVQRHSTAWKENPLQASLLSTAASKFMEKVELFKNPLLQSDIIEQVTKQLEPILHL